MSFKEVTALRKAGEIDKALAMARRDYAESIDGYSASALFWALKAVCERSVSRGELDQASDLFAEMKDVYNVVDDGEGYAERSLRYLESRLCPVASAVSELREKAKNGESESAFSSLASVDLSHAPERVRDSAGWVVFYYLRDHCESMDAAGFDAAIDRYYSIGVSAPSLCHSQILGQALKFAGLHVGYDLVGFIRRWGPDRFMQDDFERNPEVVGGMSLCERAVRRCFLDRRIPLATVIELFDGVVRPGDVASLLSAGYSSALYKDSAELNDSARFYRDADEYVARTGGIVVKNQKHSHILDMVLWQLDDARAQWFAGFFPRWGGMQCFMDADWQAKEHDGHRLPSVAERALSRLSAAVESLGLSQAPDWYVSFLEEAVRRIPEDENLSRRLAKVKYASGDAAAALEMTRNMIKTHVGKFYYWSDLAAYLPKEEVDLRISCCCKALMATKDDRYVVQVRLMLAGLLHGRGQDAEALAELEKYRQTYVDNRWNLKPAYQELMSAIPAGTVPANSNIALYRKEEMAADEYVYSDLESHVMVLVQAKEEVQKDGRKKLMFYLYDDRNKSLRINPNAFGLDRRTRPMSCFAVKYVDDGGRRKAVSVRPCASEQVLRFEQAVVVVVNRQKESVHVIGESFEMGVPMRLLYRNVKAGDILEVARTTRVKDGKTIDDCLRARKSETPCRFVRNFSGELRISENQKGRFGFVEDVYVGRNLLEGLEDCQSVSGICVCSQGKMRALTIAAVAE